MWLRFRIWKVRREIDALRARDAVLREQEVVLQERADALRGREVALEENALLLEKDETEAPLQVDARAEKDGQRLLYKQALNNPTVLMIH